MRLDNLNSGVLLFLSLAPLIFSPPAFAGKYSCGETAKISIAAPDESMVSYVCDAAHRVMGFLGQYGLKAQRTISLEIIDVPINHAGYEAYGSYARKSDRILMMSLPAIRSKLSSPQMYEMTFDEEHYIGGLAHEITHAIFHHNAAEVEDKWNNAAQEYLAHATQLAVLSPGRREEIIKRADTGPWETGDEISVTYMGFNTTGFAVKSYLHLTRLDDPQSFVQLLLNHKWLYISVP